MADIDEPPPNPTKLTLTKERWAREGRFLTGRAVRPDSQRLPPGQHEVRDWPVLDLGVQPKVGRERWQLRVFGLVEESFNWGWPELSAQAQVRSTSDIHCVTTWSRYDNDWDGVATRAILEAARPTEDARFVALHAFDGYTTNLALEDFAAPDALLAHSWDGKPLSAEHGGPVRLVVPHLYFWKSAKWLRGIEFRADNKPGYWETRGYHDRGDPWAEQRYADD
jgi:DMSO/TMAO reductase YedYZ molybdopterin-dependent catalytic subunit